MKRRSIKFKVTLWFTILFVTMLMAVLGILIAVSESFAMNDNQSELRSIVEANADELEYLETHENQELDEGDYFIRHRDGYLEVDDDFVTASNGISVALFDDNEVLFGENSLNLTTTQLPYANQTIQRYEYEGETYYVYDLQLSHHELAGLWLRGVVRRNYGTSALSYLIRLSLIAFPVLVIAAIIGGYLITKRSLNPLIDISRQAETIEEGKDLTKRIQIDNESQETIELRDTMNAMLDRLHSSFKREKQFTSDVSHELRTPLAVIQAECEYGLASEDADEQKESLQVIQRQSNRMNHLVEELLTIVRLEEGRIQRNSEHIDLKELINEVVCEQQTLWTSKNIHIHLLTSSDVTIESDRHLLRRVLTNLINNAFKYGKDNGNIWISSRFVESHIEISIKDDGEGIPEENLPLIWDRFFQGENARSRVDSTGLGLSMVQEILRYLDADISVQSTVGEGSEFLIRF